ncbi:hypothetical protein Hanom_Chr05g00410701 [Helianthus anomalus]
MLERPISSVVLQDVLVVLHVIWQLFIAQQWILVLLVKEGYFFNFVYKLCLLGIGKKDIFFNFV